MQDKKPTRKDLLQEIDRLEGILTIQTLETSRILGIFDQACVDTLDPVQVERVRARIAELTKPDEPETSPIIT